MVQTPACPAGWREVARDGLTWIECDALAEIPGIAHAFFTRRGPGGADLDASREATASEERRRLAFETVGLGADPPIVLQQVHGNVVHHVGSDSLTAEHRIGDGLVALASDRPCGALALRSADCVPLLLAQRGGRAAAAAHAGWRGVVAGVALAAVERLRTLGIPAAELVVALGPAIGPCCYEVGPEVLRAVAGVAAVPAGPAAGSGRLDLHGALHGQLGSAGVPQSAIHTAPWCTRCAPQLFFSHRREGLRSGRQLACIGFKPAVLDASSVVRQNPAFP